MAFRRRTKSTNIILIIVVIGAIVLFRTNEKANSVLTQIIGLTGGLFTSESFPATGERATSTSTQTWGTESSTSPSSSSGYSTTNRSTAPSSSTGYSTTNSEALWSEIRRGHADGDQAAQAELEEQRRQGVRR